MATFNTRKSAISFILQYLLNQNNRQKYENEIKNEMKVDHFLYLILIIFLMHAFLQNNYIYRMVNEIK